MASDRGVSGSLAQEELDPAWLAGCDHLYVSGYCLADEPGRRTVERAIGIAREGGASVSLDLSEASVIASCGVERLRELVGALRPDAVFCNEDEDRAVGGPVDRIDWILKRGARGASFAGDERGAVATVSVDSTGAGDALAAGWIVGGPGLALETAARCVAQVGAMPRAS